MTEHAHRFVFPEPDGEVTAKGVCVICGAVSTPHLVAIPEYSQWKALARMPNLTKRKRGAVFKAYQDAVTALEDGGRTL